MWNKFRGQVLRSKEEKDVNDDDTIVARALLKYYEPEIPSWLLPMDSPLRAEQMQLHAQNPQYQQPQSTQQPAVSEQRSVDPVQRLQYTRRESSPRLFDNQNQPPASNSPRQGAPGSGMASRMKNSRW